jgi:predicted DNA-binding transcriptional regulator YafY
MPDKLKRHVGAIADTVKVDLLPASNTPGSNAALIALTGAAQAQRRVKMRYESAEGSRTEREFDPYGLAWRAGAWYALGMCHLRHGLRSFRLDRVAEVSLLDHSFRRPPDFDALDQLLRSIGAIAYAHAIEVMLHTDLQTARRVFSLAFGVLEPATGGVLLRTSADDLDWFARQLAGLPFDFEIRTPAQLRVELACCATRLQGLAATVAGEPAIVVTSS